MMEIEQEKEKARQANQLKLGLALRMRGGWVPRSVQAGSAGQGPLPPYRSPHP